MTTNGDTPISVPKEMVNDDSYLIVSLAAGPGERVEAGQVLAELETSKASFSVASPATGYFYPSFEAGQMAPVGGSLGCIAAAVRDAAVSACAAGEDSSAATTPDPRFSLAAWELFLGGGLPLHVFDGFAHVRKADVEAALKSPSAATVSTSILPDLSKNGGQDSVVLLGGGGHARECIDIIESAGLLRIAGIVDTRAAPGSMIDGYPVLGDNAILDGLPAAGHNQLILAYGISGSQKARGEHFAQLIGRGFQFPSVVHARAAVNRHARLGSCVQVMAGALIGSQAGIGDGCIVNSNAVVSHDCLLADNVHVAPGALLAGGVRVGRDTVIGMGATVYMRVRIGSGVIIYNGANVFADVPDGTTVRGDWHGTAHNPA